MNRFLFRKFPVHETYYFLMIVCYTVFNHTCMLDFSELFSDHEEQEEERQETQAQTQEVTQAQETQAQQSRH